MGERVIVRSVNPDYEPICADEADGGYLLTAFIGGGEAEQIFMATDQAKRLGEWLIERANQAGEK